MIHTRRALLKHAALAGSTAFLSPTISLARSRSGEVLYVSLDDPDLRKLVRASIDAAQGAGASYADVRITYQRIRLDGAPPIRFTEQELITAGVRALVNGYWGFASGPVWDKNELVRLAREAVQLARISSSGKVKQTSLAPIPRIPDGLWTTPIKVDPFSLHPAEIRDVGFGIVNYAKSKPYYKKAGWLFQANVMDKSFGSSDGSFFSQRTYTSRVQMDYEMEDERGRQAGGIVLSNHAGAGFEIFDEEKARQEIDRLNAAGFSSLQVLPVDVGRYETVFDGSAVAEILGSTIGCASEMDRALGFEANAGGTSYLNAPDEMAGKYVIGSPLFTVHGNRTEQGGLATVQWDDEATPATNIPLVTNGVIQKFQTNRELAAGYAIDRETIASTGCAHATQGINVPLIRTPNLQMGPGSEDQDLDALIAGIEKGVLFRSLNVSMDFQQLNGLGMGPVSCFEIRKGRVTSQFMNAGVLFRAPEFWKSITKIGGSRASRRYAFRSVKGEPEQPAWASVTCPPIVCRDQTIIDYQRKA